MGTYDCYLYVSSLWEATILQCGSRSLKNCLPSLTFCLLLLLIRKLMADAFHLGIIHKLLEFRV
jgi:hypothetical protein